MDGTDKLVLRLWKDYQDWQSTQVFCESSPTIQGFAQWILTEYKVR